MKKKTSHTSEQSFANLTKKTSDDVFGHVLLILVLYGPYCSTTEAEDCDRLLLRDEEYAGTVPRVANLISFHNLELIRCSFRPIQKFI